MSVVVLCIGAAKAGTDWLYRQLRHHPDCKFRAIKELHYFNALDQGTLDRELKKHSDFHAAMLSRLAKKGGAPDFEKAQRIADRADWMDVLERGQEDIPAYLDYLRKNSGSARVVGEMTPAYALLGEERLRQMAVMAPDVRCLFLLRDPVDRLWSHIRMIAARRDDEGRVTERRCATILRRTLAGEEDQIAARSDYAGTLNRLAAAVPGGRLLVEVFEDMVRGDGLARICAFLGIAPVAGDRAPVHAGQPLAMTAMQRGQAQAWLRPQYDAAEAALGRLPDAWRREG